MSSRNNPLVLSVVDNDLAHDARVRREASSLVRNGFRVVILAREFSKTAVSRLGKVVVVGAVDHSRRNGSNFLMRFMVAVWRKFLLQFATVRLVRRIRPDVLHCHDIDILPGSWLAAKLMGCSIVYDVHELHPAREEFGFMQRPVAWIEGFLIRRVDAVIAPTGMRSEWLERFYSIRRPYVVPNRPLYSAVKRTSKLRQELRISSTDFIFLYQGVLNEGRGLHNAVRAMKHVKGTTLVFLGSGRLLGSLKALSVELGVENRVLFHPAVSLEELPTWTASADAGLQLLRNTSVNHYTTDSNKIYEYIMAGLPVIASDFPEIRRIVEWCDCGELVDPEDIEGITTAMNHLVRSPEYTRCLHENAVKSRAKISWESVEHELADVFRGVMQ